MQLFKRGEKWHRESLKDQTLLTTEKLYQKLKVAEEAEEFSNSHGNTCIGSSYLSYPNCNVTL